MPWTTPTLSDVRSLVRDAIRARLPGADALVPNSVLRVMSDNQGALCHTTLQYVDWLALQLLPDTAEVEWLDRHGEIWLVNADGSKGRKLATYATGSVMYTGTNGAIVPLGVQLTGGGGVLYETTQSTTIGSGATEGPVRALDPGVQANIEEDGQTLALVQPIAGVSSSAAVVQISGGVDTESDDDLRARILQRIQHPPMGGDADDYELWALAVPGVTRAWGAPQEMGVGTMTLRFMMDDLRASNDGWPEPGDIVTVENYIDTVRPVTVKDLFVVAPLKQFIDLKILHLNPDTDECRAEIEQSLRDMLRQMAAPGVTIYSAWITYAIMSAPTVVSFDLVTNDDFVMESPGHMATLGTILYEDT